MSELVHVPYAECQRVLAISDAVVRANAFATACRLNALYAIANAGSGHIGSSFSSLDVVTWLYLAEMNDGDRFFSSKGHDVPGLYAVLAGLGRLEFDRLHRLRRLGGLPGHPDVSVPGIVANTGSLGMGISKAKGLIDANRRASGRDPLGERSASSAPATGALPCRVAAKRVFVMLGDGELQEGQIWESLGGAVRDRMGELTAIVDANGLQSDTYVDRTAHVGDVAGRFAACGWQVETCDGHDVAAIAEVFERFREVDDRPHVLIAETRKGAGVPFMQPEAMGDDDLYAYHSGAPSPEDYAAAVAELAARANGLLASVGMKPLRLERRDEADGASTGSEHGHGRAVENTASTRTQRLIPAYDRALVTLAAERPDVVALDADLYRDCGLATFRERFPERFIECGIAEQDMVSRAGGMALGGLRPVIHSFACFLAARPNEHVYNNATEGTRIVYVGSLAGQLPGGPGHSHQATRDVAALSGVPGLTIVEPCCEAEVRPLLEYALDTAPGSTYLRLVSIPVDVPYEWPDGTAVTPGRGTTLRAGTDGVLVAHGPVACSEAYRAAERLASDGLAFAVVAMPWLNVIDVDWLEETASTYPLVATVEDHQLDGGMGQRLSAGLAECDVRPVPRVIRMGVVGTPVCGRNDEVLAAHLLDASSIAELVSMAMESIDDIAPATSHHGEGASAFVPAMDRGASC